MKRTLLTILPIAAALLLATSCSKDSDNDNGSTANTGTDDVHIVSTDESDAIPFSIKVVTSNDGLSKIGYDDAGGKVTPSFTTSDVTAKLAMTISEGTTELGTLTLQDANGNFSGNLTTAPSKDGATLTATITTTGDATSSTVSITDLMANCAHKYTGTFAYKTNTKVMLTDDKAYIEIFMSPLQHNIDVTIGSDKQNFTMSDDGKVWIAVDGGTKFTMNFTNEKTTTAGKITTINRAGFVDLGIPGGILWADKNLGATNVYDYGNYYAWGEVEPKTDYSWDSYSYGRAKVGNETHAMVNKYCPTDKSDYWYGDGSPDGITTLEASDDAATGANTKWKMPESSDFAALKSNCYWVWVTDYNSKAGYIVYKTKNDEHKGGVKFADGKDGSVDYTSSYSVADDTHIFLPAAGHCIDTPPSFEGSVGKYWSSSLFTDFPDRGCGLDFHSGSADPDCVSSRPYGRSVRPVRCK